MPESGEPMKCGIFNSYKVFSRGFGEGEDEVGDVAPPIPRGKGTGCVQMLTNCPPCILFLEQGLELMRESGEPMECGIFDFYKVFSRAFGEEEDGAAGRWSGRWGMSSRTPHAATLCKGHREDAH